ncbi:hypothetical protein TTHT_1506 [Thermotomaculum hydrothermale]|uniref:Tetratricopeptide repeat protein n=1 Tax=Thermotomaculum hydrothermale TaxID=981385 RepID=A0A7R6PRI0_9BACT|nr:tetratricopeptide repeat protein [Thermotomaculum hydrothermale]BBB33011.1 hypothetical protein TTHT_1506 [Thermotomaculum hydrothermale]
MKKSIVFLIFLTFYFSPVLAKRIHIRLKPLPASIRRVNMGVKYLKKGKLDKAMKMFDAAIKNYPSNYSAYGYKGIVYLKKNDYKNAEKNFEKALSLYPSYKKTLEKSIKESLKILERRRKKLESKVSLEGDSVSGTQDYMCGSAASLELNNRKAEEKATDEMKLKHIEERISYLKRRLETLKNEKYPLIFRIGYAETLMKMKKFEKAVEQFQFAAKDYPENKSFYPKYALSLAFAGNCAQAKQIISQATKIPPNIKKALKERCK